MSVIRAGDALSEGKLSSEQRTKRGVEGIRSVPVSGTTLHFPERTEKNNEHSSAK